MIFASNTWNASFFISSLLFGVALAMDAFSVSLANSFADPKMRKSKLFLTAGTFAIFQGAMPLIGWAICAAISNIPGFKDIFNKIVPFVALALLAFLGIKMIIEYSHNKKKTNDELVNELSPKADTSGRITKGFLITLLVQAIATSIDALSVGFESYQYDTIHAVIQSLIIAGMTFVICLVALFIGKKVGTKIGVKAILIGGIILICIGLYIFIKGILKYYCNIPLPEWM